MPRDLNRLLSPKSIAVIGGLEAERVVEQCLKFGFEGAIWPVNPKREAMHGIDCFASVAQLPAVPDAAYVAVNRERSIEVVAALSQMGCGGAVCYAAGFAEAESEVQGAINLQHRLLDASGDMPIVGPNCYGVINALTGAALWPDQHGTVRTQSGVAILTQSSNLAISITMQQRGLPIAFVGTMGNQAQTGMSELALGLLQEERITAIGLHIEGIDDVIAFEKVARLARKLEKPIIVLKAGRSEQARAATLTHTASLAGGDAAHDALFRHLAVARVESLDAFLETLKLACCGGALSSGSLISLSCSGGEAALIADAAEGMRARFLPFDHNTNADLKAQLGPIVTIANPLDYNTFIWGDWPAVETVYATAMQADCSLAMLVLDFPRGDTCDTEDWGHALAAWVAATRATGRRTAVVATMAENMPEQVARSLIAQGIAPLCGLQMALAAINACVEIGENWQKPENEPLLSNAIVQTDSQILDEFEAKQALRKFGLVTPKGSVVRLVEPDDSFEVMDVVPGGFDPHQPTLEWLDGDTGLQPPFALKALGIAHKTDVGAVRLNLQSQADVLQTMRDMAHLSGRFLLEEMSAKPDAELIVGVSRDPVVGLVMTVGAGGVLAELLADMVTLLLPTGGAQIREALSRLKINTMLEGWRGAHATDIDALIANIVCIADYATANADTLEELDVNPLFATQFGSVAVDALIVKRKPI
ncbi:MAG: acetate--CoA ligase family protein [Ahrensia sp.]|nr:acetate--CoA ligase family protein [Ahrensia sp.]